jgi:hypothetical protein
MRRPVLILLLSTLAIGAIAPAPTLAAEMATAAADPVGDWIGMVDVERPMRAAMHIKRVSGALTGTADSPDEGAFGIPMSDVILDGDHLTFTIESIDGRYDGKWDAAKQHYVGTWTQGGRMLALEFGRGTYPPPAPAVAAAPGH